MPDGEDLGLRTARPADPELLNRFAWFVRWRSRRKSIAGADRVLEMSEGSRADAATRHRGLALRTLTWQAKWRGDLDRAMALGRRGLEFLDGCDEPAAEADIHSAMGVVHYSRGHRDLALEAVARGYALLERRDCVETRVDLLATEATTLRYMGRTGQALARLTESAALASGAELARVLHNLARHHLHDRDLTSAMECAMRSVVLSRKWENRVVYPYALEVLGTCHAAEGRRDRARESFDEALRVAAEDGDARVECQVLQQSGVLALAEGRVADAVGLLKRGMNVAVRINYTLWQERFCRDLARAFEAQGDLAGAVRAFKMLEELRAGHRA